MLKTGFVRLPKINENIQRTRSIESLFQSSDAFQAFHTRERNVRNIPARKTKSLLVLLRDTKKTGCDATSCYSSFCIRILIFFLNPMWFRSFSSG